MLHTPTHTGIVYFFFIVMLAGLKKRLLSPPYLQRGPYCTLRPLDEGFFGESQRGPSSALNGPLKEDRGCSHGGGAEVEVSISVVQKGTGSVNPLTTFQSSWLSLP